MLDRHKDLQQRWVIWRTQSSDRVPALGRREAVSVASWVAANSDVVHSRRVLVQCWVDISDSRLASLQTLVIDTSEQSGPHRARSRSAANQSWGSHGEDDNVIANSTDIRVSSSTAVVDTVAVCIAGVVRVLVTSGLEVGLDSCVLVRWAWVDVGETSARLQNVSKYRSAASLDLLGSEWWQSRHPSWHRRSGPWNRQQGCMGM